MNRKVVLLSFVSAVSLMVFFTVNHSVTQAETRDINRSVFLQEIDYSFINKEITKAEYLDLLVKLNNE